MESQFLLVLAWANEPDEVRMILCHSEEDALISIQNMVFCVPDDLQVIAFVKMAGASLFKSKWPSIHANQWFHFSTAIKQCLLDEAEDHRPMLKTAIPSSIASYLRWPEWTLTIYERRQLNAEAGKLPKFVQCAEDYVLWAIENINETRAFCCSRDIIRHPANKQLYTESTIYNTLGFCEKQGHIASDVVISSKIFFLTENGRSWLQCLNNAYKESRPRKSVKSLYGGIVS